MSGYIWKHFCISVTSWFCGFLKIPSTSWSKLLNIQVKEMNSPHNNNWILELIVWITIENENCFNDKDDTIDIGWNTKDDMK